jgi:hypothetical protein
MAFLVILDKLTIITHNFLKATFSFAKNYSNLPFLNRVSQAVAPETERANREIPILIQDSKFYSSDG